ncbi:MAG: AAA family ATPase [Rhodococcus sp. (in: high G+C Gram-positive bacteria)]|uniref:AAA family ATPase n=1 Tax=Rhodococcus sp. TaxID=1831 RepID=UPI003BB14273
MDDGDCREQETTGTLIVVGGLPATGKTTIATLLARRLRTQYLRIDTIEQALVESGELKRPVTAGYAVGYAIAADQLCLGHTVVVECVNPLQLTRRAWETVAREHSARLVNVEVVCSDSVEHRRRAEHRSVDIPGLVPPTWRQIVEREYEPWEEDRLVLDTSMFDPGEAVQLVVDQLSARR